MVSSDNRSKNSSTYRRNASLIKILCACIVICLVFCVGFWLRGNDAIMSMLGIESVTNEQNSTSFDNNDTYESVAARISEVEDILDNESIDEYDLSQVTDLVLNSYIDATNDSYIHYYDEETYNNYLNNAINSQIGIGILFGEKDGFCYAVDVFEDSQAYALGVRSGDIVEAIDGVHKDNWTTAEVTNMLSKEDGEEVVITWQRAQDTDENSNTAQFTTTLTCTEYLQDNISYDVIDDVAIIDIRQISLDSAEIVKTTIQEALAAGAQAFIIDLRDVSGGYLTQAVDIASYFIQSGSIVQIQTNSSTSSRTATGEILTTLPVVLIVNENTSGTAEVLAAALQEVDHASVVGVLTQGKGTIQVMQPLSFGGALRYSAATYLTPSGRSLDGSGITPDYNVEESDDQYLTALEIARDLIS